MPSPQRISAVLASRADLTHSLRWLGFVDATGRPCENGPDPTRVAVDHLQTGAPLAVDAALRLGADWSDDSFAWQGLTGLTPLAVAVLADSMEGQVLMVPLMAHHGASLDFVDNRGRGLLDFATFSPLVDFLRERGAVGNVTHALAAGHAARCVAEEPPVDVGNPAIALQRCEWSGAIRPWLSRTLDLLEFSGPESNEPGLPAPKNPSLEAWLYPQQELRHVMTEAPNTIDRINRLIELGALDGNASFWVVAGELVEHSVTATGMAVVLDCTRGGPFLTALCSNSPMAHRADGLGRSPLHLATHPAVCAYLLEQGFSPDRPDNDGHLAVDVLPTDCRALIEAHTLSRNLPPSFLAGDGPARARL
ncbi:ankyrin repeat domain-containing protein [Luteibacter anthropi]|uniref:ankyrin repeat domain-containing protein n=1 Tax=Luteibacter anthropi TaxID=564369 RepID=UPI0020326A8D|nr:ankyrin repeat domain-containing protein [Luteibacter anthropi]URX62063.1 ankyrin repeat domain-containing protein [Luteibacter anthropi]